MESPPKKKVTEVSTNNDEIKEQRRIDIIKKRIIEERVKLQNVPFKSTTQIVQESRRKFLNLAATHYRLLQILPEYMNNIYAYIEMEEYMADDSPELNKLGKEINDGTLKDVYADKRELFNLKKYVGIYKTVKEIEIELKSHDYLQKRVPPRRLTTIDYERKNTILADAWRSSIPDRVISYNHICSKQSVSNDTNMTYNERMTRMCLWGDY